MDMTIDIATIAPAAAIIEMRGLAKNFGASQALSPVTISIGAGEFVSLIGPSGCGKSTLLKLIARLHEPSAGKIFWWGNDFSKVGGPEKKLAFVFQDPTLMPWANAARNLLRAFAPHSNRWNSPAAKPPTRANFPAGCGCASPSPARW
jgi:ABC-type sugar transport system ATPase subunit